MTTLIITFTILGVFVVGFWSAVAFYTLSITAVEPAHAVPGNVPPEEDLDEPAYIRRSYAAYRDAWNNGDERADHVSCTRLVPYTEYKAYYMHNMDECPFRG